jgi:hypothetical protein
MMATATRNRAGRQPSLGRELGLWLLLAEDARVALLLLNRIRYRALSQLLGIGPAEVNLVTFAAILGLADAAQRRTAWLRAPGTPSSVDVAVGAAAATAALAALAGPAGNGHRSNELLMAFAILHRMTAPATVVARGVARAPWRLRSAIAGQAERLSALRQEGR